MRIGIILKEDKKKSVSFTLPVDNEFELHLENKKIIKLKSGMEYKIISGNNLNFAGVTITPPINFGNKIIIKPLKRYFNIYPNVGIKINNIVTGRKFHWQKEITQYLMGALEIRNHNDCLTLINEIPLEEYLMSVATSEMNSKCPTALLESQTIAARSWILARTEKKHEEDGFDACNDDCCQRYHGTGQLTETSVKAVLNTEGMVLIYEDKICDARYSKSCGGYMEKYENVWNGDPVPYLTSGVDGAGKTKYCLCNEKDFTNWLKIAPTTFYQRKKTYSISWLCG